ncbi:hypothetical protein RUM43_013009 [Polyplax serrata]|uniref:MRH domain-containing protein n=1 Tax=Polyplax serrata TaxID=468196 RepID=A0AAN8RZ37_POLSC
MSLEEEKFLDRISPLFGQTYKTEKNGLTYVVGICVDAPKSQINASVVKIKGDTTLVVGRRNESQILGGDTWVLLRYGCEGCANNKESKCLGNHSASIYIVCDSIDHEETAFKLTEENDCHYEFVLPTTIVCEHEKEVSGSTVFLILLLVALFMYFVVGVIYRRFALNAQGCHQLPHFNFWQRIGTLCSDGCHYICRCDTEPEDSWNNITSNFDTSDRDDALLKP